MAVGVIITNAENEIEESFYVPISVEEFFSDFWEKAIEELKLKWFGLVRPGFDLTIKELPEVLIELGQIKVWAKANLDGEKLDYMFSRIELLEEKLPLAFQRDGVVVFIG